MIKINNEIIKQETFGDGTLKCTAPSIPKSRLLYNQTTIEWLYDNDSELFTLYSLTRKYQEEYPQIRITLMLPYLPHARQDRDVSNRLFTLKYFAEIINSLNFDKVFVLDPHSKVSLELINNLIPMCLFDFINNILDEKSAVMFPDKGASTKYLKVAEKYGYAQLYQNRPIIIGHKHRDVQGRIDSYELENFEDGIETVYIRDDICSYGGTFVEASKVLRAKGVKNIYLIVTHCENNILKGELLDYIDMVYTTDTICTITNNSKIKVLTNFR